MGDIDENKAWRNEFRPRTMEEYIDDDIKEIVRNRFAIKENRPNVIFVSGTHGCGKTTVCRLLTMYYLCTNPKENGEPCGECEMCRKIKETILAGENADFCEEVNEVNGTIANGKGKIQEVMQEALREPLYAKYNIVIFDECHEITSAAQNSMLKDLEDCPKHTVIFFATTDPDKMLSTIKSRCQVFLEVKKKTEKEICDRLMYISKVKGLTVSNEALKLIAKKKDRIPRDCISLLEDIAKNFNNQITADNVIRFTATIGEEFYINYFKACNSGLGSLLLFNMELKEKEINANKFISGMSRFVLDCMYSLYGVKLEDYTKEFVKAAKELFKEYTGTKFDTLLQIIEHTSQSLKNDDNQNELLITTMGMRIGKVDLYANGVLIGSQKDNANKENADGLKKYIRDEVEAGASKSNMEKINNTKKLSAVFNTIFAEQMETLSDNSGNALILSAKELNNLLDEDMTEDGVTEDEYKDYDEEKAIVKEVDIIKETSEPKKCLFVLGEEEEDPEDLEKELELPEHLKQYIPK